MKKAFLFALALVLLSFSPKREVECGYSLRVIPYYNGKYVTINQTLGPDSLVFTKIKFYTSNVSFYEAGNKKSAYILKTGLWDDGAKMYPKFGIDYGCHFEPDSLHLTLGIDSAGNSSQFMNGDKDPIHGMYWTWRSGYVHIKLEGTKKGIPFEYHLGGYQGSFASFVSLDFPLKEGIREYELQLNLDSCFSSKYAKNRIMSPCQESRNMMQDIALSAILEP